MRDLKQSYVIQDMAQGPAASALYGHLLEM